MKRIKKILAMAAAAAVLTSFGGTATAKAATSSCPPHGSYIERAISVSNPWTTTHKLTITSSSGVSEVITCTVTHQAYTIGIYCKKCNLQMSTYSYEDEIHSCTYCPDK